MACFFTNKLRFLVTYCLLLAFSSNVALAGSLTDSGVINDVQTILGATANEFEAAEAGSRDYELAQVELRKKMKGVSTESAHRGSLLAYLGELMARVLAGQEVVAQRIVQGDASGQGEAHYRASAAFADGDASVALTDVTTKNARVKQLFAIAAQLIENNTMPFSEKSNYADWAKFQKEYFFRNLNDPRYFPLIYFFAFEVLLISAAIPLNWARWNLNEKVGFTSAACIGWIILLPEVRLYLGRNAAIAAKNLAIAARNARNARDERRKARESQTELWQIFAESFSDTVETGGSGKEARALRKLVKSIQKGMVEKASAIACDMALGGTQLAEIASTAAAVQAVTGVRVTGEETKDGSEIEQVLQVDEAKIRGKGNRE